MSLKEKESLLNKTNLKEEKTVKTVKKKKKKLKCNFCNSKLGIISYTCKCGKVFCSKHLNPHSHNCAYDYKNEKKLQLEKNNPKMGTKFEKIK